MEPSKLREILALLENRYGRLRSAGSGNLYVGPEGTRFYLLHAHDANWFGPQKSILDRMDGEQDLLVLANTHYRERVIRIFAVPIRILKDQHRALGIAPSRTTPPRYSIRLKYEEDRVRVLRLDLDLSSFMVKEEGTDTVALPRELKGERMSSEATEEVELPVDQPLVALHTDLQDRGLFFDEEVLRNYFVALRTKPFVILSGISGTGKTLLAKAFAEAVVGGDAARFAFVPVRPDWLDSRGMFGFHNLLNDTFQTTPFLNLLLRAVRDPGRPYFIVLDEMNLAKVEYYFSDFLSAMESGTAIVLHSMNGALRTSEQEHEVLVPFDTEDARDPDRYIPRTVHVPRNLFLSGTVNIDETAHPFSAKVLDRANTIELSRVSVGGFFDAKEGVSGGTFESGDRLARALLSNVETAWASLRVRFDEDLSRLQEILIGKEFHFGYRTLDEMMRYVANAEGLLDERLAFDLQIRQKILPKIAGSEARIGKILETLGMFCEEKRYERSSEKIERMLGRLREEGFTGFF